jgi:hypothetical protein
MKGLVGLVLVLAGGIAVGFGATAMFAEGIRADETHTTGALSPLDIVLTAGGFCALVVGLALAFSWLAAKRR